MVDEKRQIKKRVKFNLYSTFAENDVFRYGLCCPNNPDYRKFVGEQIKRDGGSILLLTECSLICFSGRIPAIAGIVGNAGMMRSGEIPKSWNSSEWLFAYGKAARMDGRVCDVGGKACQRS